VLIGKKTTDKKLATMLKTILLSLPRTVIMQTTYEAADGSGCVAESARDHITMSTFTPLAQALQL